MLVAVDYLPGAYMFCRTSLPQEPVHFAMKGTEPSTNSGTFLIGVVILSSILGCVVLILLVGSDGTFHWVFPKQKGQGRPQLLRAISSPNSSEVTSAQQRLKASAEEDELSLRQNQRNPNVSEVSQSVSSSEVTSTRSNATTSSSRVATKAILAQDITSNDIALQSSEWRYRCHALRVFARCSSANLPDPPNIYYYTADTMGNGECQVWVNGKECLVENYNAFATLAECRRECENRSGNHENSDRCSTVVSRPCVPADRKLEYIYYTEKTGRRSACVKLPGKKCTTQEYGFASMQECRKACHPRSIGNDTRCKTGAQRRECQRHDRKYPFYYDDEEGKCLPWTDICLVSGFADRASCEILCKLR